MPLITDNMLVTGTNILWCRRRMDWVVWSGKGDGCIDAKRASPRRSTAIHTRTAHHSVVLNNLSIFGIVSCCFSKRRCRPTLRFQTVCPVVVVGFGVGTSFCGRHFSQLTGFEHRLRWVPRGSAVGHFNVVCLLRHGPYVAHDSSKAFDIGRGRPRL